MLIYKTTKEINPIKMGLVNTALFNLKCTYGTVKGDNNLMSHEKI
jgi:hypothetical protein